VPISQNRLNPTQLAHLGWFLGVGWWVRLSKSFLLWVGLGVD